jgi:hypothetical protein
VDVKARFGATTLIAIIPSAAIASERVRNECCRTIIQARKMPNATRLTGSVKVSLGLDDVAPCLLLQEHAILMFWNHWAKILVQASRVQAC